MGIERYLCRAFFVINAVFARSKWLLRATAQGASVGDIPELPAAVLPQK